MCEKQGKRQNRLSTTVKYCYSVRFLHARRHGTTYTTSESASRIRQKIMIITLQGYCYTAVTVRLNRVGSGRIFSPFRIEKTEMPLWNITAILLRVFIKKLCARMLYIAHLILSTFEPNVWNSFRSGRGATRHWHDRGLNMWRENRQFSNERLVIV